jgi:hypothetical protein
MSVTDYSRIEKEKLLEICSKSINTLDGLWFLSVESQQGFDRALDMDVEVWRRMSLIHAKRMMECFEIQTDKPLEAFIHLLQADPLKYSWTSEIEMPSENRAVLRRLACPPQEGRLKSGKGLFPGHMICLAMYDAYAHVIDPRIQVSCLTYPPCAARPMCWCEWQFEI